MKAWKLDLWITLAALIVSGLTASAALYQSKVFSDQTFRYDCVEEPPAAGNLRFQVFGCQGFDRAGAGRPAGCFSPNSETRELIANGRVTVAGIYPKIALNVYYCSLLDRCWVVRLHTSQRPQEVTGQNYPHTAIESE